MSRYYFRTLISCLFYAILQEYDIHVTVNQIDCQHACCYLCTLPPEWGDLEPCGLGGNLSQDVCIKEEFLFKYASIYVISSFVYSCDASDCCDMLFCKYCTMSNHVVVLS